LNGQINIKLKITRNGGKTMKEKLYSYSFVLKTGLSVIMAVILFTIGCATISEEEKNTALERARAAYSKAQADPKIAANAQVAMYEASQALQNAEQARDSEEMQHLAYMAERKAQLATAIAEQKMAEKEITRLSEEKDKIVLEAREREIKSAKTEAEARALEAQRARKEAEALARQAEIARKEAEARALQIEQAKTEAEARALELEKARKEAEAKALEAEQAKKETEARQREAEMARLQAEEAVAKRQQLESELKELKAKQTERGIILTLGDILFATGKDILMPGAIDTIDKLVAFLKKYPNRSVLIEGHTDSVGGETYNLGLSQRRADAVRTILISKDISENRITAKGYGESLPVASNATSGGRQQNRRVEIVISDSDKVSGEQTP
jgi:outer membrane protein OmpA-like peptidoglycan-associated protein